MKYTLLLAVFTFTSLLALAQNPKLINDRNAQKRSVGSFHGVHIGGGIALYLSQGNDEAVAVSADDPAVRDRIKVEVHEGILDIYMEDHGFHWGNWGNQHRRAYVSCKVIDQLHASGGSDVYIDDAIHSDRMRLSLSGGSDLHGKMSVGELTISQSGGADSYVTGTATNLFVHASGGSDFHGYDLIAEECTVDVSGGSDAYVTVNKGLTASASGGSDIHYKGNGVVRSSHASGAGSISHRD